MALLKAPFDGIGSGSGVAWPLFGLLMSVLSLATGGMAAIVIGTVATLIFLAISIPIFYLSYQESLEETRRQDEKSIKHWTRLFDDVGKDYAKLPIALKTYLTNSFSSPISSDKPINHKTSKQPIIDSKTNASSLSHQLDLSPLNQQFTDSKEELIIKKQLIRELILKTIPHKKIPLKLVLASALTGFVGAFGAIAGGGSGFLGLITGLGLFAGVSAVPIVGWIILSTAIVVGAILACVVAQKAIEKFYLQQEIKLIKALDAIVITINKPDKTTNQRIVTTPIKSDESKIPAPAVTDDKNCLTISPGFRKLHFIKSTITRRRSASDISIFASSSHNVLGFVDVPNDEKNLNPLMPK